MAVETPDAEDRELIGEVARDLVAELAPAELARFAVTRETYFEDPELALAQGRPHRTRALGFGAEALLAPFVLAATGAVVDWLREACAAGSREAAKETVKLLFRRGGQQAGGAAPEAGALSPDQLARIHRIVVDLGGELEVPADRARLLADSVTGRLAAGA